MSGVFDCEIILGCDKDQIPVLAIVTGGLERIQLPPLIRPAKPNDNPNGALVRSGTLYYTYCVIAHVRVVLRGIVDLLKLGNIPTAFLACRHVFKWTAHTCLMARELEDFVTKQDWMGATELQSLVMVGNRWVTEHGEKYVPGAACEEIRDSLRVKKALKAYEGGPVDWVRFISEGAPSNLRPGGRSLGGFFRVDTASVEL